MGCTHYPYLINDFEKYISKDVFIDPAKIFVDFIAEDLDKNTSKENGDEEIFVSANPKQFVKNAKLFYEVKTMPKLV